TDDKDDLWCACLFCEGCRNNWFTYWFRQKDQIPLHWRHRLSVPTCPWCSDTALQPPPEQVRTSRWPPNPYLQEYLAKHQNPASNPAILQYQTWSYSWSYSNSKSGPQKYELR